MEPGRRIVHETHPFKTVVDRNPDFSHGPCSLQTDVHSLISETARITSLYV